MAFIIPCAIFYSLDARFFNTIRMSNSLDPDQARHFVGPDLDPNSLQRLSADNNNGSLRGQRVLNTKQLVDTTFCKVNFIWLQLFPFG